MYQQYMPIEKVLSIVGNRYIALNLAAQEARRVIEGINRGEIQMHGSPYYQSMRRLVDGEVEFENTAAVKAEAEAAEAKK
jgi:DNA-directed RNA polymerase subunit K/omega